MLGRLENVGVMGWMMTYLEVPGLFLICKVAVVEWAAEDGLARGWYGFECTTSSVSVDRT